jgi:UDP-N-acetylglucosamine acyltransferase
MTATSASNTIFGNAATLGGPRARRGLRDDQRVLRRASVLPCGQHAFIGGYTVVTRDALPFAKTVGNRARIYGVNAIGLARRGFTA